MKSFTTLVPIGMQSNTLKTIIQKLNTIKKEYNEPRHCSISGLSKRLEALS